MNVVQYLHDEQFESRSPHKFSLGLSYSFYISMSKENQPKNFMGSCTLLFIKKKKKKELFYNIIDMRLYLIHVNVTFCYLYFLPSLNETLSKLFSVCILNILLFSFSDTFFFFLSSLRSSLSILLSSSCFNQSL